MFSTEHHWPLVPHFLGFIFYFLIIYNKKQQLLFKNTSYDPISTPWSLKHSLLLCFFAPCLYSATGWRLITFKVLAQGKPINKLVINWLAQGKPINKDNLQEFKKKLEILPYLLFPSVPCRLGACVRQRKMKERRGYMDLLNKYFFVCPDLD